MSTALRIVHGNFGRVALLDMDCSLVRHAHPHCHVLLSAHASDFPIPRISPAFSAIVLAFRPANSGRYPSRRADIALQPRE